MTILATAAPTGTARYSLLMASDGADVRAAQRLRYQVFADELGANLDTHDGYDADPFDEHCDHLLVRENATGEVVGTYRMLPPGRTDRLYGDGEFSLPRLAPLRDVLVETGRSCVHPEHRSGAVINLIWSGIVRYLTLTGHRWLAGCASVPLADAAGVWWQIQRGHLAPPPMRVTPRNPWPVGALDAAAVRAARSDGAARAVVPPLLRGYLRLGAWVCGPPAHDPAFGVADFFVLLSLDRMHPRYLRHFLGE
jgi:putative hemolysin